MKNTFTIRPFLSILFIILLNCFSVKSLLAQTNQQDYPNVVYDERGKPSYMNNQIIIAFKPELLKKSIIDDDKFLSGKLKDFFTEEALAFVSRIGLINDTTLSAQTFKLYPNLDSDDTLSKTRNGELIVIPKYWATLLVNWPSNNSNSTIKQVCDSLIQFYPYIEFAHPNYLYSINTPQVPNDTYYAGDQFALHPDLGSPTNGNIEIENAWDIETGSPEIKLGVFDYPIIYTHEDFGGGSLASSKIRGGKVYYPQSQAGQTIPTDIDISLFDIKTVTDNHGTSVAGIAAAIRNNDKGIAGVAGGDYANGANIGVSLYTLGIFTDGAITGTPSGYCTDAKAALAIEEGADYIPQPNGTYKGYGLNIENHSWGGTSSSDNIRRAIKGVVKNLCVNVCSRGQNNNQTGSFIDWFPATYNDEWVINVGASGVNGRRASIQQNNLGIVTGTSSWSSMQGNKMDVIAPGVQLLVTSCFIWNGVVNTPYSFCNHTDYCYFEGTSASTPHVSGLAALLLSKYRPANHFNNTLEPEDVENLIEKCANHLAPSPTFYNDDQAWGIINPDNTLDKIKDNRYQIYHFSNGQSSFSNMGNINLTLKDQFKIANGTYAAEKWKVTHKSTHTFAANEQILGYWPRINASEGSNDFGANAISEDDWSGYTFTLSSNNLTVDAVSFAYFIPSLNQWLYKNKADVKTAYSVHTFDPTANGIDELKTKKINLKIYPNPAKDQVKIDLKSLRFQSIEMYNVNGMLQKTDYTMAGNQIVINTSNLADGLYICKTIMADNGVSINKILIQK